jgi:hypothetical protein
MLEEIADLKRQIEELKVFDIRRLLYRHNELTFKQEYGQFIILIGDKQVCRENRLGLAMDYVEFTSQRTRTVSPEMEKIQRELDDIEALKAAAYSRWNTEEKRLRDIRESVRTRRNQLATKERFDIK